MWKCQHSKPFPPQVGHGASSEQPTKTEDTVDKYNSVTIEKKREHDHNGQELCLSHRTEGTEVKLKTIRLSSMNITEN